MVSATEVCFDKAKYMNSRGDVNLGQYVKNSRHAQQHAWSSLFDEYERLRTSSLGKVKAAERFIIDKLQYHSSGRLEALARALYTLKKDGLSYAQKGFDLQYKYCHWKCMLKTGLSSGG
jgi:hypothetical protein